MIRHRSISHALVSILSLLLIAGVSMPGAVCYAKSAESEWAFPEHYPKKFEGQGRIYSIEKEVIVIDDRSFGFSPFVQFSTPTKEHASSSQFRPGNLVGFLVNDKKQIEGLYLLRE
ncbi:MAG: hypothetical protein ACOC6E_01680 [Thermodesulfobacteriota bacterium]